MKNLLAGLSILPMYVAFSAVSHAAQLTGEEIRALVSDKTVYAYHEKKDFEITTYFAPDGTLKSVRNNEKYTGKWRIEGDTHCIQFNDPFSGQPRKDRCMYIEKDGDTVKRIKETPNGKRIHIITYRRFADGNAEGL